MSKRKKLTPKSAISTLISPPPRSRPLFSEKPEKNAEISRERRIFPAKNLLEKERKKKKVDEAAREKRIVFIIIW